MWWSVFAVCLLLAVVESSSNHVVKSLHITSDIKNRYATTHVTSKVANTGDKASKVPFYVTFPDSAFLTEFAIEENGREVKATLHKNEDVKDLDKEFGEDVLSVFVRDANQFAVLVNVEAKAEVTFKLTYEELLSRHLEIYSHKIHVNPQQIVDDLKVTVNIEEPTIITYLKVLKFHGFSNVFSRDNDKDSEIATIENKSPQSKVIVWAPSADQQRAMNAKGIQGEIVVQYNLDRLEHAEPYLVDDGHYFADFFAVEALPSLKKHVIFVIDYSYSMEGEKFEEFKQAMDVILPYLSAKDYFSIVLAQSFAEAWSPSTLYRKGPDTQDEVDREEMLKSEHNLTDTLSPQFLVEASPANVELALKYLKEAELGGSYLMGGLKTAVDLANLGADQWKAESDSPLPLIVFLSDGQPTIGEVDEAVIVNQVTSLNTKHVPIYSLAFGYYADYEFLRKLSLNNHGFVWKVYRDEDASQQIVYYYKHVASPVLTDLAFTYFPTKVEEVTRHEFPVFFRGMEIAVAGKLKDAVTENDTIGELTANIPSVSETYNHSIPVGRKVAGNSAEKTFAFLKLRQLLGELHRLPEDSDKSSLEEKIENLALKYSFMTSLTSLVIEKPDGSKTVAEFTPLKQAPPLEKTDLKKITWLKEYLTDDAADHVSVTLKEHSYNLALKPGEETFGKCNVNYMSGECRHFQKCALAIFEDDVAEFLPYKCDIAGDYLGACCPFHVS
ncbi:inter-alpha-trypsin inhibitor heavy chain H4-like [Homalodisca vitripennis]|uniref:inter-alpha-trypsin inhibitor heavy chain H4-like n=1 Tax=Homalodisca vitripennis TaxID=197043 RepID=UPI001EEA7921|nr:inter-alpha-trypsin inhibitor heavy chain H4-like [Homalodisca vitripennis]